MLSKQDTAPDYPGADTQAFPLFELEAQTRLGLVRAVWRNRERLCVLANIWRGGASTFSGDNFKRARES
jgi:hypothetical protein